MDFNELIKTDPESAQAALMDMLQQKAFDYLDSYTLEDTIDEAVVPGSVKKDAEGNVESFKTVPDKKDSVVKGSVKKDDKGNIISFKTEDFEAMSQEEFDAIDEEQLDELSKTTLASYVKKASKDAKYKGFNAGYTEGSATAKAKKRGDGMGAGWEEDDKAHARLAGVRKAVDKLVK